MRGEIQRCQCGKRPVLKRDECEFMYEAVNNVQYAYFCDCGEVGYIGNSPSVALERWNRRAKIREEIANSAQQLKERHGVKTPQRPFSGTLAVR